MSRSRIIFIVFLVFAAALSRVLPHPPNFTPVAAMALLCGRYFPSLWSAIAVVLSAMLLSDFIIGFHDQIVPVYASFILSVYLGHRMREIQSTAGGVSLVLVNSLVFFFATNFGVWLVTDMYPRTAAGLAVCFTAALPFFQYTVVGDLFYAAVLFGAVALAESIAGLPEEELPAVQAS